VAAFTHRAVALRALPAGTGHAPEAIPVWRAWPTASLSSLAPRDKALACARGHARIAHRWGHRRVSDGLEVVWCELLVGAAHGIIAHR
jgi:hypothetical protein